MVELRTEKNELYVQYLTLAQAIKARNYLSSSQNGGAQSLPEIQNGALHIDDDIEIVIRQEGEASKFTTEFFPLELWYKMET